jgi:hypothetical protein
MLARKWPALMNNRILGATTCRKRLTVLHATEPRFKQSPADSLRILGTRFSELPGQSTREGSEQSVPGYKACVGSARPEERHLVEHSHTRK